jgi:hypothetical protein
MKIEYRIQNTGDRKQNGEGGDLVIDYLLFTIDYCSLASMPLCLSGFVAMSRFEKTKPIFIRVK